MNATLHIAGPLGPDQIQRCARCLTPLKDLRFGHVQRVIPAVVGGIEYPQGAEIERGATYQAMSLVRNPDAKPCRILTSGSIVDELTYRSYAANRQLSPEITPERWTAVYPNALSLEERYQQETKTAQPLKVGA